MSQPVRKKKNLNVIHVFSFQHCNYIYNNFENKLLYATELHCIAFMNNLQESTGMQYCILFVKKLFFLDCEKLECTQHFYHYYL